MPCLLRGAKADGGAADDEGGARVVFGGLDGFVDGFHIVAVVHLLDVPAIGFEARGAVFGEGQVGGAVDGDVVVVVEVDQPSQGEMPGQRGGFGGDAFHQVAVGDDGVDVGIDQFEAGPVEGRGKMRGGNGHADAGGKALSQRAGGGLHAGGQPVFGVAGGEAAPLAEVLELLEGQVVAGEMQQGVEQHGAVPAGEDEAVAVGPARVARVVTQVARPEGVGHGSRAHRQPGMSGVGLLDGVGGEKANGVDGAVLKVCIHVHFLEMRCPILPLTDNRRVRGEH